MCSWMADSPSVCTSPAMSSQLCWLCWSIHIASAFSFSSMLSVVKYWTHACDSDDRSKTSPFILCLEMMGQTVFDIFLVVISLLAIVFLSVFMNIGGISKSGWYNNIIKIPEMTYFICFIFTVLQSSRREDCIIFVCFPTAVFLPATRKLAKDGWYYSKQQLKTVT